MRTVGRIFMAAIFLSAGLLLPGTAFADKYLQRVSVNPSAKKASTTHKNKKKKSSRGHAKSAKADKKDNLSRDMVFTGTDINGKYLSAGESVATVETEKNLNQLIGMRKDFRDRLAAEKERLKTADASEGK